jgi:hypothetical protein
MQGVWRSEPGWPLERARSVELRPEPADGIDELEVEGDVGVSAWISCAARLPWGQPSDQRADDARSLTYDWRLDEELAPAAVSAARIASARSGTSSPGMRTPIQTSQPGAWSRCSSDQTTGISSDTARP